MAIQFGESNAILWDASNQAVAQMFTEMSDIFQIAIPSVVDIYKNEVPVFKDPLDLSAVDALRAPNADPKVLDLEFEFQPIKLNEFALAVPIDRQNRINMNEIGRGSSSSVGSAAYGYAVNRLTKALMFNIHKSWKTEIEDDTNFGSAIYDVTASSTAWSNVAATPQADLNELKKLYEARQGTTPEYLIVDHSIVRALHSVTEWVDFWGAGRNIPATKEEQLAEYFDVPKVYILKQFSGSSGNYTNYYDGVVMFATIDPIGTGEVLGSTIANRSAFRFYFRDQASELAQERTPIVTNKGAGLTWANRLLIKYWEEFERSYRTSIQARSEFKLQVSNPYGLAKLKNVI